ncbi:MAG: hypothetical protein MI864_17855 [Pseudomonadales bacterium]|nr:hypothetical protein [Pseudomonadales bacterium]
MKGKIFGIIITSLTMIACDGSDSNSISEANIDKLCQKRIYAAQIAVRNINDEQLIGSYNIIGHFENENGVLTEPDVNRVSNGEYIISTPHEARLKIAIISEFFTPAVRVFESLSLMTCDEPIHKVDIYVCPKEERCLNDK